MTLPVFDIKYKKSFRVCVPSDPAIDIAKSDLMAYGRDADEKHLRFIPGQVPTWFYLRWLGQDTFARITDNIASNVISMQVSFSYCVEKIENPPTGGAVMLPSLPITGMGYNIFNVGDFAEVFDLNTVMWVGGVAYCRHFLVNGTEPTYSLPLALVAFIHSKKPKTVATSDTAEPKTQ